jgi:hypothetical protein
METCVACDGTGVVVLYTEYTRTGPARVVTGPCLLCSGKKTPPGVPTGTPCS